MERKIKKPEKFCPVVQASKIKPDFDQKTGTGRPGDITDMSERHKAFF